MHVFKEESLELEGDKALRFLINRMPRPGQMTGEHWHDYYEILYVEKGGARQSINRCEQCIGPGDVVIIEPGDVHTTWSTGETGAVIFVLLFYPAALDFKSGRAERSRYLDAFLNSGRLCSGYLLHPYAYEEEIGRIAVRIREECTGHRQGYALMVKGLVYEFLGYLNRSGEQVLFGQVSDERLQKILAICRFVESRFAPPPTLAEAARAFGYSAEHLSRLFREATGKTFKAYVDYVRIEEAKRLLRYEKKTVTETAERLGYTSAACFNRAFKRLCGCNPSEF